MGTLRLRLPFEGSFPVTQEFGENETIYRKWNLPGHEGRDWWMPKGTPVLAVADGTVGYLSTAGNYGNAIRLVHPWGESVYAHLSKFLVAVGQKVKAGQVVGLSGATGNVTGPHLHFGLRISPFFRDSKKDPYQGFCDPRRYFEPSQFLLGPHIINGGGEMLAVLRQWQPAVAVVLDPDPGFVLDLSRLCPNTKIVGRIYHADSEVEDRINRDPVGAAQWMDRAVRSYPAYATGKVAYWQVANEVCQGPEWDPYVRLNTCMNAWVDLAKGDYKCALFSFGVGHPDTPGNDPNWWNLIKPTLRKAKLAGHVLLIHEYGYKPGLDGPLNSKGKTTAEWHSQRYINQVWPYVRDCDLIVGEFGLDPRLVGIKSGWRENGYGADEYADLCVAKEANYGRYRNVLGVCIFTLGSTAMWTSYDIVGRVSERIAAEAELQRRDQVAVTQPPVVEPPSMADFATAALTAGKKQSRLPFSRDNALYKAMKAAGYAIASDEFTFSFDGGTYVGQWGEEFANSGPTRLYYVPFGKWDEVRYLKT